mgnify:CR=1 FL=1
MIEHTDARKVDWVCDSRSSMTRSVKLCVCIYVRVVGGRARIGPCFALGLVSFVFSLFSSAAWACSPESVVPVLISTPCGLLICDRAQFSTLRKCLLLRCFLCSTTRRYHMCVGIAFSSKQHFRLRLVAPATPFCMPDLSAELLMA